MPNVSGLIDNSRHGPPGLALSSGGFALMALIIWEGNRRIYFRLQQREDWRRGRCAGSRCSSAPFWFTPCPWQQV